MNLLFEFPVAFAAFAALPVLAAIYLLRNRFRQVTVSSLMLWIDQRRHRQGGLNIDRLQTPLLFVLELLILLLLAAAAVGPLLRSKNTTHHLIMVLDDSFSMQAQDFRQNARQEIMQYLRDWQPFQATFIQAGPEPQVLAADVQNAALAASALEQWQCLSPSADIEKALALAGQLAGQMARIIVITDYMPAAVEPESRVEYWSFGDPLANLGFVHAQRSLAGAKDRALLVLGNFSGQTRTTTLTIKSLADDAVVYEKEIEILPDQPFQMIFQPQSDLDLIASIPDDALDIDNQVILLKPINKQVRTAVDLKESPLSESVSSVLEAIPTVRRTADAPDLLITDVAVSETTDPLLWTLQITSDPNSNAFVGPFIIDRNHPLAEGLDLQGIIWSAAKRSTNFMPIISAGNTNLLENRGTSLAPRLHLYINPQRSNLHQSPNWPILLWNLVHWRRQHLPGLLQSNFRITDTVTYQVPPDTGRLQMMCPDGRKQNYDNTAALIVIETDTPGIYQLVTDMDQSSFAVNAVSAGESDLRVCRTIRRTNPNQAAQFWWEYRRVDWVLLLIAAALLSLHRYIVWFQAKGGGP